MILSPLLRSSHITGCRDLTQVLPAERDVLRHFLVVVPGVNFWIKTVRDNR